MKIPLQKVTLFVIFLIAISVKSFWGYGLFHRNALVTTITLMIPISLLCLIYSMKHPQINRVVFSLAFSLFSVILLSSSFNPRECLYYGFCILMLFFADVNGFHKIPMWFYYAGIFFAIGSLINIFAVDVYCSLILPAFSGSPLYGNLLKWVNKNIYPGFTSQTAFNAGYLIYAIGYLYCNYSINKKIENRHKLFLFLLLVCLVLTNKRAHFLFLFVTMAICSLVYETKKQKVIQILKIVLSGIALLSAFYLLMQFVDIGVFQKLRLMLEVYDRNNDVSSGRFYLYLLAIKYFFQNPFIGVGWGGFSQLPELAAKPMQTHDIYLQLLCETGILGFIIFILFFAYSLFVSIKNCNGAKTSEQILSARFCFFVQSFFLLYGLTGNTLYDQPYFIVYFLICAFTFSLRKDIYNSNVTS